MYEIHTNVSQYYQITQFYYLVAEVTLMTTISGQRRPVIPRHVTKGTCALIYCLQSSVQCVNDKSSSIYVYYI